MDFEELGEFAHFGGGIWFRTGSHDQWFEVARLEEVRSLFSQSPFSIFDVVFDKVTGRLFVLLEDRALVGRFDADLQKPAFEYQFSGDIVLHPLSGKVLVWAGEPLTQSRQDEPDLIIQDEGLWEMSPQTPKRVSGFQALARQTSTGIPFMSFVYHEPSGLTLTSHSDGFATYDGEKLLDLSSWRSRQGEMEGNPRLAKIGNAYFAKGHRTLLKIKPDLSVQEITLPEPVEWLYGVVFSEALDNYFLFSFAWANTYNTKDFVKFSKVVDAPSRVRSLLGDLPSEQGLFGNSDREAFRIQFCVEPAKHE